MKAIARKGLYKQRGQVGIFHFPRKRLTVKEPNRFVA